MAEAGKATDCNSVYPGSIPGAASAGAAYPCKTPGEDAEVTETRDKRSELLARMVLRCRERHALSQQQFSELSGIGRATISKIEQGRIFPAKIIRRKLATALGITPEQLWEEVNAEHDEPHTSAADTAI